MPAAFISDVEMSCEIALRYFRTAPSQRWMALVAFIERTRDFMAGQPDLYRADALHQLAKVATDGLLKYRGEGEDVTQLHCATLLARFPPPRVFAHDDVDAWAAQCGACYFAIAANDRWTGLLELFERMSDAMPDEDARRRFFNTVADRMAQLNLEADPTVLNHAAALRCLCDAQPVVH